MTASTIDPLTVWACVCGAIYPYPDVRCRCGGVASSQRSLSGTGVVYAASTWTQQDNTERIVVLVTSDDAPSIRFLATSVNGEPPIGTRVEAVGYDDCDIPVVVARGGSSEA